MRSIKNLEVSSITLAIAVGFLLICPVQAGGQSPTDMAAQSLSDTLRIGFLQQIDSLNPSYGLSDPSWFFYGLVYDSLQSVDEDMQTVPNLALESRIVDVDGTPHGSVWEYNLTHSASWHDGEPFTATDVAWNINLQCLGTNYSDMWAYQPHTFFYRYAEVVDPDTVRVFFYDRSSGTPIPCAFGNFLPIYILPYHLLKTYTTSFIGFQWLGYFQGVSPPIVGTGPFMVTSSIASEFQTGDVITLVRNPNHHAAVDRGESVHFQNLILKFYDDSTSMRLALESGDIDVAQFPPDAYKSIATDVAAGDLPNIAAHNGLKCTQYWTDIGFNMNVAGPNRWRLDQVARQALAHAIDKTYIKNAFYSGYGREGTGLVSPVLPYWHWEPTDEGLLSYNITEAAGALETAGYVDTNSDGWRECTVSSLAVQNGWALEGARLNLEMLVRVEHPEEKSIAMYLESQWAQIGVDLSFSVVTEDNLAKIVYSYSYDSCIWYWSADPDPNYILFCQSQRSWYGWSDNMYSNPSYEENYTSSVSELDPSKRQEYVRTCQSISYEDAAYIVLTYLEGTYAWRTDTFTGWGNWSAHPGRTLDACWGANPLLFDLVSASEPMVVREHAGDFRIPLPASWTYEENYTAQGEEFDMAAFGPEYGGFVTNILITSESDRSASESTKYLSKQMNDTIDELEAEGLQISVAYGTSRFWSTPNYSAVAFTIFWESPVIAQYIALYASEEHDRVWVIVCSASQSILSTLESTFYAITTGFEVIREPSGSDTVLIAALVVTGAVAATVIVLMVLFARRKTYPQASPHGSPVPQSSIAPPSGFCPICGHVQNFTNRACVRCGSILPSPPFGEARPPPPK